MKPDNQQQKQQAVTTSPQSSQQGQVASVAAIDRLKEFGGFSFLENIIDGFSNLNPNRKARRNIFLTDEQWALERKALQTVCPYGWICYETMILPRKCVIRQKKQLFRLKNY